MANKHIVPVLIFDSSRSKNVHCDVFCSSAKPGISSARLFWDKTGFNPDKQRIDVTIYKNGFQMNLFTSLWPIKTGEIFQPSSQDKRKGGNKVVGSVLTLMNIEPNAQNNMMSIDLDGLEPGINYFWRILSLEDKGWVPGDYVNCVGLTCPSEVDSLNTAIE